MQITTTSQLSQYLHNHKIPFKTLTPLTGGSTNFVWRLCSDQPNNNSSIIKHAEPFLSGPFINAPSNSNKPRLEFPLDRMKFEIDALRILPSLLHQAQEKEKKDKDVIQINLPQILYHDEDTHILQLSDVGSRTLHDSYTDSSLDIPAIGVSIGQWLARLHQCTTSETTRSQFDHKVAKRMYRWNYNGLAHVLASFGFDPEVGRRINERFGACIETDDVCVCHTDLWPGNILLRYRDDDDFGGDGKKDDSGGGKSELDDGVSELTSESKFQLSIIDWEVTRNGDGMTDVGHFAGETFFLDRLRGGRGLLKAFLEGYRRQKGELSERERARVAAEFGTRITFWPTIYAWIGKDEKRDVVSYGHAILEKVLAEDWKWFENSDLSILFRSEI